LRGEGAQIGGASVGNVRVERQKASQAAIVFSTVPFCQGAWGAQK
jgi:hypothetical protein